MADTQELQTLRIAVRAVPAINGHEVVLSGDRGNLLDQLSGEFMGMDPTDLLWDPSPLAAGATPRTATLGRCRCGEAFCSRLDIEIVREAGVVRWTNEALSQEVSFAAEQYDAELERAMGDLGWETPGRTAARLIHFGVDHEALRRHGLRFEWASGRIASGQMTLSLACTPGPYQLLVEVDWSDEVPEVIARKCTELLATPPSSWDKVVWLPQADELGPPSIAGPGWKPDADE